MKIIYSVLILLITVSGFGQNQTVLAQKFLDNGKVDQARRVLSDVLKEKPDDLKALALMGDIAGFEKNWDNAMDYYHKLLVLHPNNAEYNFKYGGALGMKALSVSKLKAAVYISDLKKHLEKATELNPNHIKSRRALVELYMQLPYILGGSEQKSHKYARELEKIDALEGALARGYILKETNKEKEASSKYREAQQLYTSSARQSADNNLNYEIGKISAEYGINRELGLSALKKYIQNYGYKDIYSPEWAYYRIAQIEAQNKNKPEAILSIEKALSLDSNFKEAQEEKIRILSL